MIPIILVFPPLVLLITLTIIYMALSYSSPEELETITPFECGLDHHTSARTPFSIRFFLLAVVFLVFDIETALLLPLPILELRDRGPLLGILLFIFVVCAGLAHE